MDVLNKLKARFSAWCGNVVAVYEEKQFQRSLATLMPLAEKRFADHPSKEHAIHMATQSFDYLRFPHGPKSSFEQISIQFAMSLNLIEDILYLRNFVGVQPMSGPVGLSYVMQYSNPAEGSSLPKIDIVSKPVVASTHLYRTYFPMEVMQDLSASTVDQTKEALIDTLRRDLSDEWIIHVFRDLLQAAATNITVDLPTHNVSAKDGRALQWAIMQASNEIAAKTRRGAGNYAILSPLQVTILANHCDQYVPTSESGSISRIKLVGVLNDKIKIYEHDFTPDQLAAIIVGYNGVSDVDVGYVLAPYIVLLSAGMTMDMQTFQPTITFKNRFATSTHDGFTNGSNYCRVTPCYS